MKSKWIVLMMAFACVAFSGCAAKMSVSITPKPSIARADMGKGTALAVKVADSRSTKILGHWYGNSFYDEADVVTGEELSAPFQREIESGLKRKGFAITPFRDDAPVRLVIDIAQFEYTQVFGVWLQGVTCKASLKATAFKKGKEYEEAYAAAVSDNLVMIRQDYVENIVNKVTDEIIEKIVNDAELMSFLTH